MDGMVGLAEDWLGICALEEIPERGARRLALGDLHIGVFRTQTGEVYAIDNRCPHLGGPLTEGIVHDSAVTCPLHNWIIDLKTGMARGADEGCVSVFPVEIREGRVFVKVPT